jgi:hypothetical protein
LTGTEHPHISLQLALQPPMLCQSWPASHPIKSQSRFVIGV